MLTAGSDGPKVGLPDLGGAATLPACFAHSAINARSCPDFPRLAAAGPGRPGFLAPDAHAQRVSARDKVKVDALQQRMTAAEKRYSDALLLVSNADPKGSNEADAALEDMEDVLNDCVKQKGCQMGTLLASYKRLLKHDADAAASDEVADEGGDRWKPTPTTSARSPRTCRGRAPRC